MALSPVARTKRDGQTAIQDDGATNSITVVLEPGDFQYAAPGYTQVIVMDRGERDHRRRGDAQPVTLGWSFHPTELGSATEACIPDICEDRGWWAANATSTTDGESDEKTWDIVHTIDGTFVGESDHTLTFPDCFVTGSFQEGDPDVYSVSAETTSAIKPTYA